MSIDPPDRTPLPQGWFRPDDDTALNLHAELLRELPPGHVLTGREVETIAWREGATDDVLFRHADKPDRFTVVHLTWRGRTEISSEYPCGVRRVLRGIPG